MAWKEFFDNILDQDKLPPILRLEPGNSVIVEILDDFPRDVTTEQGTTFAIDVKHEGVVKTIMSKSVSFWRPLAQQFYARGNLKGLVIRINCQETPSGKRKYEIEVLEDKR